MHLIEGDTKDIDEGRVPWKTVFIEDSMRGDDELLHSRVPEPPGLRALRVANEDALPAVGLQRFAVLLAHEHVGQTAKHPEVGHIRVLFVTLPHSVGDATAQRRCRHAVACMDKGRGSMAPERPREL